MAETDVKILGTRSSPFVMRSQIALKIKSVDYEFLEENLVKKSILLLQSNPVHKKVPVLIHGDKLICESLVIIQYIDETWSSGPSILPSDLYDRAVARFWANYIDQTWFPSLFALLFTKGEEAKGKAIKQLLAGMELFEDAFKKCSKGKAFFGGDSIGYIDITLGCFLAWIRVSEKFNGLAILDTEKTPYLVSWAEKFCADSTVKEVMPEVDKLAEFAIKLEAHMNASASN
ncbi:hypothetical protein GIB67_031239 [Kingdonia uniflora]|uniref:Glutathione S-transferase n=1 Tax=Kingdonia uniflora TaxID=39325 RepID=A0A7J7NKI7_9MAGN|nr:hypothetical protein GIB67_031239 [Kingdonia uniflora]